MKITDNKKAATYLWLLWLFSLIVVGEGFSAFSDNQVSSIGMIAENALGWQIALIALLAFYFCPLMFFVYRYTRKAGMRRLSFLACILLVHHVICLVGIITQIMSF